ncbi:MAG: hypothetical protein QOF04_1084 [Solirubrobacteraceae bacterium]|jgi:hypothetical protein|nr:hypothetical protein [Solirubrobacteraceae bacterium]
MKDGVTCEDGPTVLEGPRTEIRRQDSGLPARRRQTRVPRDHEAMYGLLARALSGAW